MIQIIISFVCFDSRSLFYIKLHITGRIEHQQDKENLAREISFLLDCHRVQIIRKEVQPKNVTPICVRKHRLKLLILFGQKLNLPLRSSKYLPSILELTLILFYVSIRSIIYFQSLTLSDPVR